MRHKRCSFNPWVEKISWNRRWAPSPVFLPGKSHGQGSLADYNPWGCKEPDTTEYSHTRAHTHTHTHAHMHTHTHTDSIYYYMFETWLRYAKLKKPVAKVILMIPFSSNVQNCKYIEMRKYRLMLVWSWAGSMEWKLTGMKFLFETMQMV